MAHKQVWEEEAPAMNTELSDAFDKIERKIEDESGKTRALVKETEMQLNRHLLESAVMRTKMEAHLTEHQGRSRWWWGVLSGLVLALVGGGIALIVKVLAK